MRRMDAASVRACRAHPCITLVGPTSVPFGRCCTHPEEMPAEYQDGSHQGVRSHEHHGSGWYVGVELTEYLGFVAVLSQHIDCRLRRTGRVPHLEGEARCRATHGFPLIGLGAVDDGRVVCHQCSFHTAAIDAVARLELKLRQQCDYCISCTLIFRRVDSESLVKKGDRTFCDEQCAGCSNDDANDHDEVVHLNSLWSLCWAELPLAMLGCLSVCLPKYRRCEYRNETFIF